MLPYFSGERTPIHDTHAKGTIFGLNLTHTRGDLFRAALEGIAFGTHHILETYDDVGETPRNIFAVGGGTRNRVWAQATSDISGKTQILRSKSMGASYGNAFLAAIAVGDARLETSKPIRLPQNSSPTQSMLNFTGNTTKAFRPLYERNCDLMKELGR